MANHRKEEMESRLSLYLHTAAEIVTQVGAILDPEAFLSAAVTLLKERFDLYHVHVYTLDEGAGDLVMRAGYGEAGRVMKEQGHKIPLSSERSLVAQAARTREVVTVGDVTKDPEFLPNPLLPDTKSEVAIPLVVGERVLGVFDIQDDTLDRFSSVELDVFRTLSGQLAVTLQNAQLFAERKKTEEALKRERRLFVGGPVVVFRWVNAEGWPVEYASPNLESFIGYSAEDLMNGVVPYANLVYPDDLMHVAEEVAGYTEEGRASFEQEYRMVKANGDVIWIYDFTTIVRNERGQVTHYDGYIMDITERKRAEEVLEKRLVAMTKPLDDVSGITFEDLFNLADIQRLQDEFADATGVASIITHPDGTPITRPSRFCHFCNDIVRKTGKGLANCYRSDAALGRLSPNGPTIQPCMSGGLWDAGAGISVGGRHIANWLIGQVRDETQTEEKMRAYAREIEADEEILVEAFRDVPAMSYERFQQISQALFTLANQLSTSAYQNVQQARFITEYKQTEEALKRERRLFVGGPVVVFRWVNAEGWPVEYASPNLESFIGYSAEDLMNGVVPYAKLVHPDDLMRVAEEVGAHTKEGRTSFEQEYRMVKANGDVIWIYDFTTIIRNERGEVTHYDGYIMDITERQQTQTNLRTIFNSVYDAVFIHGVDGSILDVNDKLLELYGVTREQAPKFSIAEDYSSPENPLDELPVTWQKVLAGEPQYFEWKARRPNDGTTFDAEVFLRKITMGDKDVVMANIRDVSDRKQAEAERVRFTERLAVAADIATQVNTILDPDELLETVIPLIKERFGLYYVHVYTVDEAEGVLRLRAGYGEPGRIMVERGHKIPLDAEKSLVARAARTKEMVPVDDVRADPEFLPNPLLPETKSEVAVPAIAGGKVLGVFDVQHDVAAYFTEADLDVFRTLAGQIATAFQNAQIFAERKRAEEAALQEKYFADAVINSLPGIFFMHDAQGKLVRCNKAYQEVFGFSDADLASVYALERFPEEERELILSVMEKIFTEPEQQSVEGHLLTKDGKTPFNLMAQRLIVGDEVYLLGTGTDITDRKRAEKAIQEQQAFLNQVINASPDLIFVKDYDSRYVLANRALADLYGTTPEEMIGKTDADFSPTETEVEFFQAQDRKVIDTQEEVQIPEESIADTQGREHWFQIVKLPLVGPSGKADRVLGVGADITTLKQFTTQLGTAADISTQVNTVLDPDILLEQVIPLIKERFGLYYVHVYTVDEAEGVLKLRAGYGEPGRIMVERGHKIPLDAEKSLVARAARTKKMVLVDDVRADPEFLPNPLLPDTKSEVAVPMVVGDRVLGVFDVQHDEAAYFTESYLDVFSTLAGQIATAFQNAQYFEQIERSLAGTEARLRVSQALAEVQTEEAVLDAMIQVAGFHPQAEVSIYTSVEGEEGKVTLRRVAAFDSGIETKMPAGTQFSMKDVPLFAHLSPDKLFVSNDLAEDETVDPASRAMAAELGLASIGLLPIMAGRTWLGFISINSKVQDAFDDRVLYLYQNLAEQGAVALQAARLRESLQVTRASVDQARDAFFWFDGEARFTDVNETTCKVLGYTREELLAMTVFDIDPDFPREAWGNLKQQVKQSGFMNLESHHRAKDGRVFPVDVTMSYLQVGDEELYFSFARDITERKQAEAERVRFTEQLGLAADISTQANAILDPDELLAAVIPLIKERFGLYFVHVYTVDEAEGMLKLRAGYGEPGRIMVERGHKIPLDAEKSLVARAARTQEMVLVDDVRADPEFLPNPLLPDTKSEVAVPAIAGGKVLGVFDVQHDEAAYFTESDLDVFRTLAGQIATALQNAQLFAERKEAERALLESRARLQALFNAIPDMIFQFDKLGTFLEYKAESGAELAAPPELFLGKQVGAVLPPAIAEVTIEKIKEALKTGETVSYEYQLPVGETLHSYEARMASSGGDTVTAMVRDITDRKQAEVALRESEARLLQALRIAKMGYWEEDVATQTFTFNDQYYAAIHDTTAEAVGGYDMSSEEFARRFMVAEEGPIVGETFQKALAATDPNYQTQFETRNLTAGGEERWVSVWFSVEKDAQGRAVRFHGVNQDITDRKQAEVERERFATQLATAAEIATQVNTILDPDELLQTVIPLIKERFGLYYVHTYAVDEAEGVLKLRAGYGEPGRIMVEQGHKIPLDAEKSLVARAARTQEIVLVDDVRADPDFLPNPLLPDTKSEVAVPAIVGGKVLGVLDVQHDVAHYFTDSDLDVLRTMNEQIATAFQNASLYAESREVQRRLQTLMTNLPGMAYRMRNEPDWPIEFASEGCLALTGYMPEQLALGPKNVATYGNLIHPEDRDRVWEETEAGLEATQSYQVTYRIHTAEGELKSVWEQGRGVYSSSGELVAIEGFIADITDRQRAAEAMAEQQAFLDQVINASPDLIFVKDYDSKYVLANRALAGLYGTTPEEMIGKTDADFSPTETEVEFFRAQDRKVIDTQEEVQIPEESITDTQGREHWFQIVKLPLMGPSGKADRVLGVGADITALKQFTTQLGTAADISTQVNTVLDPDELLQSVIPLIKERFGLYYVHVYTVDEAEGVLKLRAGYGEPGRIMVERGHHIPLDAEKSLVARAARTKEMVLVDDVRADPEFLPNPLLPDTKSEVAVPMVVGDRVLGVFDVQHDEAHYFTESYLDVFSTLAGQIATAFQNAQLFAERAQTEVERETQRVFMRQVIDAVPEFIFVKDREGVFTLANESLAKAYGTTVDELTGKNESEFIPNAEDAKKFHAADLAVIDSGQDLLIPEETITDASGSVRWLQTTKRPLRGAEGKLDQLLGVSVDITEQRQAQANLRTIFNSVYDAVFIHSVDGSILDVNDQLLKVYGVTREQAPNFSIAEDYSSPENPLDELSVSWQKVLAGEPQYFEWKARRPNDGTTFDAEVFLRKISMGDRDVVMANVRDVSERKQAEAERERFAQQLGVAADISAQVNTILDPDELLQAVIPLIKERFGLYYVHVYTVDEAEGVLKLRAGYGEPGRIMVERGHKIPLDAEKSLVARAARTKEMVLVDDVRADPEFLPNPLLPDTKSEVAVPAIAGGKVLGVFDVQHDVAAYFTEVDLDVFRTLAGQIATAFQNANLYAESQNERAFYDGIITNLPVGVWAVDQSFNPLLVNPVGKTMMGREIEDQHGGAYVEQYDVVNVDTGEHYQEPELPLVKTITQGGKHAATDAALRWPDGTLVPMLINSAPLTDAEGKQTGAVVIFVDMTEQKKAEQAALQEKNFADTVINSLPGIFFMHDTQGKLVRCNKAYQELFGFSDADLANVTAIDRFPEEEREFIGSTMGKIFTTGELQSAETYLLTKEGKTPYSMMAQRLIVGGEVYLVGTGMDITDRKRAEKAIQEQQAFLNQVINASPDLIFVKDYDSKYVLANQALAGLYGTTPEEMIGKTDVDFSPTQTEVAYFQAQDRKVIDAQEEVLIPEESITDTQGREHWFQVVKLPLLGPSGKVDRVLGVGADITKLKQFTTQLSTAADISTQVNTELDPDTLLQSVIPLIKERFGLYYVHVYTVDEAEGVLKLRAGYGEPGRVMLERGHSIPLAREQSLVARAARTKQVVAVDDVRADPDFLPNPLLPDTKSEVAVPMVVGDRVLGVFDVQHDEAHYFTESYLDVFSALAGQIATALQNAQYFEQVERSLAGTEARLRVSQALAEVQTEEAVLDAMIQVAGFHPQAEVSIYTSVEDGEGQVVLRRVAAFDSGIETKIPAGTQFAMSDVPLFAHLSPDKPFVSNNVAEDEAVDPAIRAMAEQVGIASLGIMPIMAGRTPLGFISIFSKVPDAFDDRVLYLYQNLAEQGAAALQSARLQDAVKESEERFRVLYENSPLGFILNDFDKGDYLTANDAFLAMTGYTLDELNQLSYWDLTPKKYEADEAEQIRSMNETGRYGPYEKEYIRKGGEAFPVTLNGVVVTDSTGRKLIWSVVENITERRQAEQALHVTRASVDAASDMIYWFDADARFIDVNEATIRMLGYTREELLTMGVFDVDPHFPREAWPGLKEQLRKQTSVNLEGFNRTKDGRLIPVEVIVSYVEFGGQEYYFSLARDITDRRQAEAERQRFTTQLGTAAEVATRANAILNPEELLNAVVALVKERFDLYHAHVYTFDEKNQDLVLQAGYGEPGRVMKEQGHKIPLDVEQSLVARAARMHELLVVDDVTKEAGFLPNPLLPDTRSEVAVPLMVGDRLLGVFDVQDAQVGRFVAGDLSVLQTLAGQVSTALQNALYFDEIQKTTARLREMDRLKSEFLANMSHELRTPLNSIIGYSEVLMMGIDGDLEPETLEDIKAIYDNGQHLLAMINDILDLAKIEAGRMTLKTEELDLVLMVEEVKSATMGLFHKKPEVEFQVVIDGELPVIRGDRIRLSQVFINLVSNAEKFTEKGSVKVRAYRQGRHWNCITVEDTGIGIPENEISGLFEKFHQVDGSSKRRAQGTGLGLAISRELVQLHGGRIEVRSKYGEGSSFTVWLPVAE